MARAYTVYENQARVRTDGAVDGPAPGTTALYFNGESDFAFIDHDTAWQVSQGTIALWVRPDDLSDEGMFLSKDESGRGDGGHFRLGHTDDGGLILRMAPGDGRWSNRTWETKDAVLTEGEWTHLAVSFTDEGVVVYIDGVAVPDRLWCAVEGDTPTPGVYGEAYLTNNAEPWVIGADTVWTHHNDTAQEFATDRSRLVHAYEGAIADLGIWGGPSREDALSQAEIQDLIANGPGAALTNPFGIQTMLAADDVIDGAGGNDMIDGGAGDDHLMGSWGDDELQGGYGDDHLEGGAGNDVLDGGRGSDWLEGGAGDDLLIAWSDAGEDRAGQLVLGEPTRELGGSIDPVTLKLVDWTDQALVADDILTGGAGRDHFYFETRINAKLDIIMKHVEDDRTIDWMGVAGENREVHDHWVDSLGIDVITDFDADEDTISVIGHTTNIRIDYQSIDSNGDGMDDSIVSIIEVYSQQGSGGGAHDEDNLGWIVVHGDLVTEDMVNTDAGVHFGIVDTIDQLQEALAPTGEEKLTTLADGRVIKGYDSRDVDGDPIAVDPEAFSDNPFLGNVTFADQAVGGAGAPEVLLSYDAGSFDGTAGYEIAHTDALEQEDGALVLSFAADEVGGREMALFSKDHSGYQTGGHLTVWIDGSGYVKVRFQSDSESRYLKSHGIQIQAGESYNLAFTFSQGILALYLNGELVDTEEGYVGGMLGNAEDVMIGASTRYRREEDDNADWFFDGTISNVAILDRPLTNLEAMVLDRNGGEVASILDTGTGGGAGTTEPGDPMTGTDRADEISGTPSDDVIEGLGGDDLLIAQGGNDTVRGGDGNDILRGNSGDDVLEGGAGSDILAGQEGNDVMSGGTGDDMLRGRTGDDDIDGGDGDDRLLGGDGADVLTGGAGNDMISAGSGDDTITGGVGRDWIRPGAGADTIIFDAYGLVDADRIRGFDSGEDRLAFDTSVFGIADLSTAFVVGAEAVDADDRLIYHRDLGRLWFDADGTGDIAPELVARFDRGTQIALDDLMTL